MKKWRLTPGESRARSGGGKSGLQCRSRQICIGYKSKFRYEPVLLDFAEKSHRAQQKKCGCGNGCLRGRPRSHGGPLGHYRSFIGRGVPSYVKLTGLDCLHDLLLCLQVKLFKMSNRSAFKTGHQIGGIGILCFFKSVPTTFCAIKTMTTTFFAIQVDFIGAHLNCSKVLSGNYMNLSERNYRVESIKFSTYRRYGNMY